MAEGNNYRLLQPKLKQAASQTRNVGFCRERRSQTALREASIAQQSDLVRGCVRKLGVNVVNTAYVALAPGVAMACFKPN